MKTKYSIYIHIGLMFMLLSFFLVIGRVVAQESFPDFLGDDMNEGDLLEVPAERTISDPLETMNRAFFEINDQLYEGIFKPVNKGYTWLIPLEIREGLGNFFTNITMPIRLINSLLQGNLEKSGVVLERFLINSTLGVYGFADVADAEFDIKPRRADFDQTLGKWGLGEGIYLCWPLLGPSSVRGTVGLVVDAKTNLVYYFIDDRAWQLAYYTTGRVNNLSLNPEAYEDLKRFSLDPYIAARQAYYDYRKALVDNE